MEIIGVIIAGIVIGLLGKFIAPGDKDNIPIWLTVVCGIAGVIIGWFVYSAFGGDGSNGIDWTRWIVAILVAAVLVVLASTLDRPSIERQEPTGDTRAHRGRRGSQPTDKPTTERASTEHSGVWSRGAGTGWLRR